MLERSNTCSTRLCGGNTFLDLFSDIIGSHILFYKQLYLFFRFAFDKLCLIRHLCGNILFNQRFDVVALHLHFDRAFDLLLLLLTDESCFNALFVCIRIEAQRRKDLRSDRLSHLGFDSGSDLRFDGLANLCFYDVSLRIDGGSNFFKSNPLRFFKHNTFVKRFQNAFKYGRIIIDRKSGYLNTCGGNLTACNAEQRLINLLCTRIQFAVLTGKLTETGIQCRCTGRELL